MSKEKILISLHVVDKEEFEKVAKYGDVIDTQGNVLYQIEGDIIRLPDGREAIFVPAEIARKFVNAYCEARAACVEEYAGLPADKCPLANEAGDACTVPSVQNMTAEELMDALLKIAFGTKNTIQGG